MKTPEGEASEHHRGEHESDHHKGRGGGERSSAEEKMRPSNTEGEGEVSGTAQRER